MQRSMIHGDIAPGFERVYQAFVENFLRRGEIGAACTIYYQGQKVVDLWGGWNNKEKKIPWDENTNSLVFSATKGIVALIAAHWVSKGYIAYTDPIARYWPEFAQHGKENITLMQLLNHKAGLHCLDKKLTIEDFGDFSSFSDLLARQIPKSGDGYAYHAQTIGWYLDALCRKIDPKGRSISDYMQEDLIQPLDLSFFIGLPNTFPLEKVATMYDYSLWKFFLHRKKSTSAFLKNILNPWSETTRTMRNPSLKHLKDLSVPPWCYIPLPGSNGIGTARSLARLYHVLVQMAGPVRISEEVRNHLRNPEQIIEMDRIVGGRASYHLGWKQSGLLMGSNDKIYGFPGWGGAYACTDLDRGLSYAYTPNRLGYLLWNDPRDVALRHALMTSKGVCV